MLREDRRIERANRAKNLARLPMPELLEEVAVCSNELRRRLACAEPLNEFEIRDRILRD